MVFAHARERCEISSSALRALTFASRPSSLPLLHEVTPLRCHWWTARHQEDRSGMQRSSAYGPGAATSALRVSEAHGSSAAPLLGLPRRHSRDPHEVIHATTTALKDTLEDIRSLSHRITCLEASRKPRQDAAQLQDSLAAPVTRLEDELMALRDASAARFETLRKQVDSLDATRSSLAQLIHSISRGAEDKGKRVTLDSQRSPKREDASSWRNENEPRRRPMATSINSVALSTRARSKSPDSRNKRSRHDVATHLPSTSTPQVPEAGPYFTIPGWAQVGLQSWPLPGGEAYLSVVDAINLASTWQPRVDNAMVVAAIRRIDPGLFEREGVQRWKELLPRAQRFLALHLDLPKMQRDLRELRGEYVVLLDPHRPWYSSPVTPPRYQSQVESLCKRAGVDTQAWQQRSLAAGPLSRTPEPPMPMPLPLPLPLPPPGPPPPPLMHEPTTENKLSRRQRKRQRFQFWQTGKVGSGANRW